MRRNIMAAIIPLAALCLFAPTTVAKAETTTNKITDDNGAYTVTIPTDVSIDQNSKSAECTVSAELASYNQLDITIESDNSYRLKDGNNDGLSYTLTDSTGQKVEKITYSTKDVTDDSKKSFDTTLKAKLDDDAVAKVSGTYEDTLKFKIECTKYYKVNFAVNTTDSVTIDQQYKMVPAGATYGELPKPERADWYFEGWYTDSEHNTNSKEIKVNESDKVTGDTTIYAHWYYTWIVEYDANGGSGETMPDTLHGWYTRKKVSANTYTKDGYNFGGWYMSRMNNGKEEWSYGNANAGWVDPNHWYTEDSMEAKNLTKYILPDKNVLQGCTYIHNDVITLHAIWNPNTYTVKYNNNSLIDSGVSGTMDDSTMTYDGEETLSKCTFENSNKEAHFIGWNTKPDGTGIAYTDEQETPNLTSDVNGSVTLYAQWGYDNTVIVQFEDVNGEFQPEDQKTITTQLPAGKEFTWDYTDLDDYKRDAEQWNHQWKPEDGYTKIKYTTSQKTKETTIKIYRQMYYLDLNSQWYDSDGTSKTGGANLIWDGVTTAKVKVEINGEVQSKYTEATDYFVQQRYGSTFKFTITMEDGYQFNGISGNRSDQPLSNVQVTGNIVTGIVTGERHNDNSTGNIGPYDATTVALMIQKKKADSTTNSIEEQSRDKNIANSKFPIINQDVMQKEKSGIEIKSLKETEKASKEKNISKTKEAIVSDSQ